MDFGQLLNWHALMAVGSGILSVVSGFVYIRDIIKGSTRPNAVSFLLWTTLQWIAFFAQLSSGASLSIVLVFFVSLNMTVVTALALGGYGYRSYGRVELYCAILAVVAIVAWQLTGNPLFAIGFAIAGDLFAFIPTFVKTYKEPHSESAASWGIISAASILGVLATNKIDAINLAFPLYLLLSNAAIFTFAFVGQKNHS